MNINKEIPGYRSTTIAVEELGCVLQEVMTKTQNKWISCPREDLLPSYYIQSITPAVSDENQDIDVYRVALYHKNEVCPDAFRTYSSWAQAEDELDIRNKQIAVTSDTFEQLSSYLNNQKVVEKPFRYRMCAVYVTETDQTIEKYIKHTKNAVEKVLEAKRQNNGLLYFIQSVEDVSKQKNIPNLKKVIFYLGPTSNIDGTKIYANMAQVCRELYPEAQREAKNAKALSQSKSSGNVER